MILGYVGQEFIEIILARSYGQVALSLLLPGRVVAIKRNPGHDDATQG